MLKDGNRQEPFSNGNIQQTKPNIPKSACVLTGWIGNSMNAGHNRTVHWKRVMAGEKIYEYKMHLKMQTLTPITPTFQNIKCTARAFYVPDTRVWTNAELYQAQRGGSTEAKIKEVPNLGGLQVTNIVDNNINTQQRYNTNMTNTDRWKNHWLSSYLPRMGQFQKTLTIDTPTINLPKVSIIPMRGMIAIYNDYLRNKAYDEELQEYHGDEVTPIEWQRYKGDWTVNINMDIETMRAKKDNSYYTDYRTSIQGFELEQPDLFPDNSLISWASWEAKIAEARAQALNENLNTWDIIAKIRGSKVTTENRVMLLGEKTFNLNYAAITQNAYNNAENIAPEFKVLGKQGAYSFTEVDLPLFAGMEFKQDGYIHIILTVTADTVYEKAIDRTVLNITPLDEYRPDLKDDKFDLLYEIETDATNPTSTNIIGYKRKFSEYTTKMPNIIAGDMTNDNYYQMEWGTPTFNPDAQTETQKTFQFFETERNTINLWDGRTVYKKPWLDYSDIMMNKNLAIQEDVETELGQYTIAQVKGQHQIFLVGKAVCLCELPIDSDTIHNKLDWGEH